MADRHMSLLPIADHPRPHSHDGKQTRYSGDFVDGRLHGSGSKMDVVGQVWEGQWCDGLMHGEGRHSAAESGEFEGDWVKGEYQGKGRMTFKG